jgi:hypothetical protein
VVAAAFRRDPRAAAAEWGPDGRRGRFVVVGRLIDYTVLPGSLMTSRIFTFGDGTWEHVWCKDVEYMPGTPIEQGPWPKGELEIRTSGAASGDRFVNSLELEDCAIVSDGARSTAGPREARIRIDDLAGAFRRDALTADAEWGRGGRRGHFVVVGPVSEYIPDRGGGPAHGGRIEFRDTNLALANCGYVDGDMPGAMELSQWPAGTDVAFRTSGATIDASGELTFGNCALVVDDADR